VLNSTGLSYADSPEQRALIMRSCWSLAAKSRGVEGRMVIDIAVDAQGDVTEARAADAGSPWARQVAECLGRRLRFNPATGPDGQAIASSARLPLVFSIVDEDGNGGISKPRLISTADDIEGAYRKCYPQELGAAGPTAQVTYRAMLGTLGGIMTAKVEKSSGDERLDQAGRCVLKTLRFEPSRRDGMPVEVSFPWTLSVRPPAG
jgi:TonB family protein